MFQAHRLHSTAQTGGDSVRQHLCSICLFPHLDANGTIYHMSDVEFLTGRGWQRIGGPSDGTVPSCETWRRGWQPFCVEIELWGTGEIRGRLCAPGLKIQGNMVFEALRSVPDAVDFLERLLEGATKALPSNGGTRPSLHKEEP